MEGRAGVQRTPEANLAQLERLFESVEPDGTTKSFPEPPEGRGDRGERPGGRYRGLGNLVVEDLGPDHPGEDYE